MNVTCLVTFCILACSAKAQADLAVTRSLYAAAGNHRDSLLALDNLLNHVDVKSPAVLICYKGAAKIISAKFTYNPFKRYRAFLNGKQLIETALAKDTGNIEMRFLRFTMQTNLPVVLGYSGNIAEDKNYIVSHFRFVKDVTVRSLVLSYFKSSGCCTVGDVKSLQND